MAKRKNAPIKADKPTRLTALNDGLERDSKKVKVQKRDTVKYQQKVDRVYRYIRDGMSPSEIYSTMLVEDEGLTESIFTVMLTDAYNIAEVAIHKDREYVFQLHMDRYEKMYEESIKLTNSWGQPLDPKRDWQVIRARYIAALQALEAKEKLLGLHDRSMVLEFSDQQALVVEKEEHRGNVLFNHDFDKLTLDEKKELLALIQSCRTIPITGVQRVVIKKTVIEITEGGNREIVNKIQNIDNVDVVKTHDITYEEMPPNVVEKFEPLPDKHPEEEPVGPGSVIVDDHTEGLLDGEKKSGKDVADAVNKNILEDLKKKMKKKT